jgi:hypothetical protein
VGGQARPPALRRRLTSVYSWAFMSPVPQAEADDMPREGMLALMEHMTAMSLAPWNFAEPESGNMPTVSFGDGRGLVTVLVLDDRREMFVTKVQWLT